MNKEQITTIVNKIRTSSNEMDAVVWLLSTMEDIPNQEKLIGKLRKASGLINKVKRDLNRLL